MKALGQGSIASIIRIGLQTLTILLWVGLAVTLSTAAGAVVTGVGLHLGWFAPFQIDRNLDVTSEGVTLDGEGLAVLGWPVVVATVIAAAVVIFGALIIVDRLQKLFANFTSNQPFNRANADHLRVIWMVMLGLELSKFGFALAFGLAFARFGMPDSMDVRIEPPIDLSTWASILVLIVLAEVFREGARLREDQDLTI
jgi:hypothetical protein